MLQQLLYADEVRSLKDLEIEKLTPSAAELKLALQLIDQISADSYEPTLFEDEEKKRILAAIDAKIAGKEVVAVDHPEDGPSGEVIDLTEMLRASLARAGTSAPKRTGTPSSGNGVTTMGSAERKGAKRILKPAVAEAPARARQRK